VSIAEAARSSLDELIARRVDFLTDYQDEAWARRYLALVEKVRHAERALPGAGAALPLTEAVARGFHKLMAYKDEYEVARLYTSGQFAERLNEQFEGELPDCSCILRRRCWPSASAKGRTGQAASTVAWVLPVFAEGAGAACAACGARRSMCLDYTAGASR
jgi:hypothetical protein